MFLLLQELLRHMPALQHVVLTEDYGYWSTGLCDHLLPTVVSELQGNTTVHTMEFDGDVRLKSAVEEVASLITGTTALKYAHFRGKSIVSFGEDVSQLQSAFQKLAVATRARPGFQCAAFHAIAIYDDDITEDTMTQVITAVVRMCRLSKYAAQHHTHCS
jgi:hypothetical protein